MIKRDILILSIVILIIAIIGCGFAILSLNNSPNSSNNLSNQNTSMNVTVSTSNSSSVTTSKTPEAKSYTCSYCKGVGYYESKNICKNCNGLGKIGDSACPTCQGSGFGDGTKKIRCDGCGGDGILNPGNPGYGNPI